MRDKNLEYIAKSDERETATMINTSNKVAENTINSLSIVVLNVLMNNQENGILSTPATIKICSGLCASNKNACERQLEHNLLVKVMSLLKNLDLIFRLNNRDSISSDDKFEYRCSVRGRKLLQELSEVNKASQIDYFKDKVVSIMKELNLPP